MTFTLTCLCGKVLHAKAELAGKVAPCPACGHLLQIPSSHSPIQGSPSAFVCVDCKGTFPAEMGIDDDGLIRCQGCSTRQSGRFVGRIAALVALILGLGAVAIWLLVSGGQEESAPPPQPAIATPAKVEVNRAADEEMLAEQKKEGRQTAAAPLSVLSNPPPPPKPTPSQVFQKASPAVIRVLAKDSTGKVIGQGSGFFLDSEGLLVTNYHVIKEANSASAVLESNAEFPVIGITAIDEANDLALLKVQGKGLTHLRLHTGALPIVGDAVYAVGNPQGLTNTFSAGIISAVREVGTPPTASTALQTTAPISPGSSGGPLLSSEGAVLGVTTAYLPLGQNLNFAVPFTSVKRLLDKQSEPMPFKVAPKPRLVVVGDFKPRIRLDVQGPEDDMTKTIISYVSRELRGLGDVTVVEKDEHYVVGILALPTDLLNGQRVGYTLSLVVTEIESPYQIQLQGRTLKPWELPWNRIEKRGINRCHSILGVGSNDLVEAAKGLALKIDTDVLEPDRKEYQKALDEFGR